MGFLSSLLSVIGFGIGIPFGLLVGFFLFIFFEPRDVKDPVVQPFHELDKSALVDLLPEIPLWVKNSDYDRVDWLNKFLFDMWPYLDKAICSAIRSMAHPIFSEYIGKFQIKSIEFENLSLGTLPPTIHGIKFYETNEKEVIIETVMRWAGNPNIVLEVKLMSLTVTIQLVDLQILATTRIALKPLVPSFPCFAGITVSLMDEPHVDFGMRILGGDIMAIPGLYQFIQKAIKSQVASLYLWPQTLEIPILDGSIGVMNKPVGILRVKVIRALKLLKMDILGTSDPYVKLSLSGDRLPAKKTTIKMRNLNPEWNEEFKLIVKDPKSQILQLHVYDWEKVGAHDKLGMQVVPLSILTPHETKEFTFDLVKNPNTNDPQNKKKRGQIVVELTFNPLRDDSGYLDGRNETGIDGDLDSTPSHGAGLLLVTLQGAEDVEGKHHNNPYALVIFRGEQKRTKSIRKTRDPCWNEEFQFMLEEAPFDEKIRIEVMSKRRIPFLSSKESLGHVDINLIDVVHNGRINEKYHLINSRNGVINVELSWKTT